MHMIVLVLVLAIGIFIFVAYGDIRTRRIPNEFIVGILALAAFRMALTANPSAALYTLVAAQRFLSGRFCCSGAGFSGAAMSS